MPPLNEIVVEYDFDSCVRHEIKIHYLQNFQQLFFHTLSLLYSTNTLCNIQLCETGVCYRCCRHPVSICKHLFAVILLFLVCSTLSFAEYCAPVWTNNYLVKAIDTKLIKNMRIISDCLKSTPVPWRYVFSNTPHLHSQWQESVIREYNKTISNSFIQMHIEFLATGT